MFVIRLTFLYKTLMHLVNFLHPKMFLKKKRFIYEKRGKGGGKTEIIKKKKERKMSRRII